MREGIDQLFMGFFKERDTSTGRVSASVRLVLIPAKIKSDYNGNYLAYIVWADPDRSDLPQDDGIAHRGGPYKLRNLDQNGISEGRGRIHARLTEMYCLVRFESGHSFKECYDTIWESVRQFPGYKKSSVDASTGLLSSLLRGPSAPIEPLPDAPYWIAEWTKWLEWLKWLDELEGGEPERIKTSRYLVRDMVVRGAGDTRIKINALIMSVRSGIQLESDKRAAW